LYFYYDGEISEEDYDSARNISGEVYCDFPEHHHEVHVLRWDYPKLIPHEGVETVYYRRES
jgi:hypothetical protein